MNVEKSAGTILAIKSLFCFFKQKQHNLEIIRS